MNSVRQYIILILCALPSLVWPQPDFTKASVFEGVRYFRDAKNPAVAYYTPGGLKIKQNRDGKPDFNFIKTRYTGNTTYGDRGETRFLSYLRFGVVMETIPDEKLSEIKKKLWPGGEGHLRPLPVTDIKTVLIFTSISENQEPAVFTSGHLSAEGPEGINKKGRYWKERDFSLRLDNHSAQLLSKAFEAGQPLMSLSYAFFSTGLNKPKDSLIAEGRNIIQEEIKKYIEQQNDTISAGQVCILSDAFSITIDIQKWPGLIKNIDINEQIPPGYAMLEVRCYDFNNNLRPDLYAKKIEVKASGVGRGDVIVKKTFSKKYPDIYVYNIRFPYAVRLDKPLSYRTISISDDAPPVKTGWIQQKSWTEIIDITSSEDEIVKDSEQ